MLYMKKNHEYCFQVQLQLLVTVSFYAIFVVYTEHNLEYVLVESDEDRLNWLSPRESFFSEIILYQNLFLKNSVQQRFPFF